MHKVCFSNRLDRDRPVPRPILRQKGRAVCALQETARGI